MLFIASRATTDVGVHLFRLAMKIAMKRPNTDHVYNAPPTNNEHSIQITIGEELLE